MKAYLFTALFYLLSLVLNAQVGLNASLFEHVKNAPETSNIEKLTDYLKQGAKNDKEIATLLAYWMMDNISYDVKSFVSGSYPPSDWETTWRSKKAVCSGYANLYQELCNRVNLKSEVISGYAKGFGYKKDTKFHRSNHAWNFIEVDEELLLLDLTWASGYVEYEGNQLKFVKFIKPEMLFTRPEIFVEDHLPTQKRWQLLNHPVSFENYLRYSMASDMIDSTSTYFNYADSIDLYVGLPEIERTIANAKAIALVNPQDEDLPHYYERIAYNLAQHTDSQHQLGKAKKFYQKAKSLHRKTNDQKRCDQGIKFVDFYLKKM